MKRIFYVEDEPFLGKIVKDTLATNGYEVDHFVDGQKAIDGFEMDAFDICVLDIMLPNVNGFSVAESIRKVDASIPIIFLTAKDQTDDLLKGFKVGGNDYIKKPFSIEELLVRIENLLTLSGTGNISTNVVETISIGEYFVFHTSRFLLEFGKEKIQLSHKENSILSLLCKSINGVVERKEILMDTWGDDSFYNSRNLDVYITKLRNLLKRDDAIKIRTLKGVGYSLIVDSKP